MPWEGDRGNQMPMNFLLYLLITGLFSPAPSIPAAETTFVLWSNKADDWFIGGRRWVTTTPTQHHPSTTASRPSLQSLEKHTKKHTKNTQITFAHVHFLCVHRFHTPALFGGIVWPCKLCLSSLWCHSGLFLVRNSGKRHLGTNWFCPNICCFFAEKMIGLSLTK